MSETLTLTPALSPGFSRAKKLSRAMAMIFTITYWLTLAGAILCLGTPLEPLIEHGGHGMVEGAGIAISLDGLSIMQCVWVMLALEITIVPVVFLMHHTRRVFSHFAKGEVFVLPVIVHIRQAGLWLIISFFAPIVGQIALNALKLSHGQTHESAWPLVIGVVTTIAAYVMEEARRIAADHAEIV